MRQDYDLTNEDVFATWVETWPVRGPRAALKVVANLASALNLRATHDRRGRHFVSGSVADLQVFRRAFEDLRATANLRYCRAMRELDSYLAGLTEALYPTTPPACPACGGPLRLEWTSATRGEYRCPRCGWRGGRVNALKVDYGAYAAGSANSGRLLSTGGGDEPLST